MDWLGVEASCPNRGNHYQPGIPDGYLARQAWFREMAKIHTQTKCTACGLFVIWVPKAKCETCGKFMKNAALHQRRYHQKESK